MSNPKDRSRDQRRVALIGKMGPGFGREELRQSDVFPDVRSRITGEMKYDPSLMNKEQRERWESNPSTAGKPVKETLVDIQRGEGKPELITSQMPGKKGK